MARFLLILIFSCQHECEPPTATIRSYDTREECRTAGELWLLPAANPDGTVRTFRCVTVNHPR